MKLTINKLIANDIINYSMDQTKKSNYILHLNSYLDDFDDESKEYILKNMPYSCTLSLVEYRFWLFLFWPLAGHVGS